MKEITFTPDWDGGYFNVMISVGDCIEIREKELGKDTVSIRKAVIHQEDKPEKDFLYEIDGKLLSLKTTVRTTGNFVYLLTKED